MKGKKVKVFCKIFKAEKNRQFFLFHQPIFYQIFISDILSPKDSVKAGVCFILHTARCTTWPRLKILPRARKVVIKVLVTPPGFEPRQTESESVVLPLYYGASVNLFS